MQRKRIFVIAILLIQILATEVIAYNYKEQLDSTKSEIYERIEEIVKTGKSLPILPIYMTRGIIQKKSLM